MRQSILKGIYSNIDSDFREAYPRNMMPIVMPTGISEGYLRPAEGIVPFATGINADRGGINWRGACYRVSGSKLIKISPIGAVTIIGEVDTGGQVSFDYSFDLLAIASGNKMFYSDGVSVFPTTDPDFGVVIDMLWVDGYFMVTDGANVAVTELGDPYAVNPLKYASSEVDPDKIQCLLKIRNEVHVLNRNSIEVFQNIGGDNFPFQRINGAVVPRGPLGTHCATIFLENIAMLGSGRNEPPAVWLADTGSSTNISTREVDLVLREFTEYQLSTAVVEARVDSAQKLLYIHLPTKTLVYDAAASQVAEQPIWHIRTTSLVGDGIYRAINHVWVYDKWIVGDPTGASIGYLSSEISSHYGHVNGWEFGTAVFYNGGNGVLFRELELACLTGRVTPGVNPTVWTSYSIDGMSWSNEKSRTLGTSGQTLKRINWYNQGFMRQMRMQKFRGNSDSHLSVAALQVKLEPLNG